MIHPLLLPIDTQFYFYFTLQGSLSFILSAVSGIMLIGNVYSVNLARVWENYSPELLPEPIETG